MTKNVTNFNKSFRRKAPALIKGKPCHHSRHFHNCARVVVQKLEYRVQTDADRFVWAGPKWFQRHCIDWETKKPFDPRMIRAVFKFLRELGIITTDRRERDGVMFDGWIVVDHATLTKIEGKWCVFCDETSAETSSDTSALSEKTSAETSAKNEKNFRSDFRSKQSKPQEKTQDSGTRKKVFHGVVQGPIQSSQVNAENTLNTPNAADGEKQNQPTGESSSLSDLTLREIVGQDMSLEQILDIISDGEFETGALETYDRISALRDACRQACAELAAVQFTNRTVCKRIMERVNKILLADGIKPPRGWVPVLKTLKQGGPLHLTPEPAPKPREGSLWDSDCAASWYRKELQPFEADLLPLVKIYGRPIGWAALITFLDAVKNESPEFIAARAHICTERGEYNRTIASKYVDVVGLRR